MKKKKQNCNKCNEKSLKLHFRSNFNLACLESLDVLLDINRRQSRREFNVNLTKEKYLT